MTEHDRWKKVLAYAAGIIILAVCLILALFFPDWYGRWQDEQLIGKVTLESRENIEFLDGDSLDIAGRMKKLGEATSIEWGFGGRYDVEDNDLYVDDWAYANTNQQKNTQRCRELLKQWWEAGLLPEDCSSWIDERYHLILYIEPALYVNDSVLPVCFLAFANEHIEEADLYDAVTGDEAVSNEDQVDLLLVLMDAEKDMIYYASIAGAAMQKAMLHELGYESEQQLRENLVNETIVLKKPDVTAYDFAAVCGAESAKITAEPGQLELRAALQYDNYEAYAGRSLIWNEGGYGQAILFGTPRWQRLIRQLLGALGSEELLMTTELWCNLMLGQISHDEALDLLNTASIYQDYSGVNAEVFEAANAVETELAEEYEQIIQ